MQINHAAQDLPAGGIVDATGFSRDAKCGSDPFAGLGMPLSLHLGYTTFHMAKAWRPQTGQHIECAGGGHMRYPKYSGSVLRPVKGFSEKVVVSFDAATAGAGAAFINNVGMSGCTIDMFEVSSDNKIALGLYAVSNTGPFDDLSVINQDNGQYLWVGRSSAENAPPATNSEGITFRDFFGLSRSIDPPCGTLCAMVVIEETNELAFTGARTKIMRRSNGKFPAGSIGVLIRSNGASSVNGIDFISTSVAGVETGWSVRREAGSAAPKWIRILDGVCEGYRVCVELTGDATYRSQFNSIQNVRCHTQVGADAVCARLDWAANNTVIWDEHSTQGRLVDLTENSTANTVWAQPDQVQDLGRNNLVFGRGANGEFMLTSPLKLRKATYGTLGRAADGSLEYCQDCKATNPCASGGTGALAAKVNGAWVCFAGTSNPPRQ
ncbi:MAG: hypothetical protein HYX26_07015 [Acidobacteriales bacterium]|nr:hypothetical protein [Terriglobales bacterium]